MPFGYPADPVQTATSHQRLSKAIKRMNKHQSHQQATIMTDQQIDQQTMPERILLSLLCGSERHGWINPSLALGLAQWAADERFDLEIIRAYDFHTSLEARNWSAQQLIESECRWLLMIDNDTRIDPCGTLVCLPELCLLGLDVVAAPVPVLQDGSLYINAYMASQDHEGLYRSSYDDELSCALETLETGGILERDAVGFGAVAIRREVIERLGTSPLIPSCPGWRDSSGQLTGSGPYPVFLRPRNGFGSTLKGEDLYFCERAKLHGFRIYSSLRHGCGHYHTIDQGRIPVIRAAMKRRPGKDQYLLESWPRIPEPGEMTITPEIGSVLRRLIVSLPKPSVSILELGCGLSTCVMADELSRRKHGGRLLSLETNEEIADRTRMIISEWLAARPANLEASVITVPDYTRGMEQAKQLGEFDLVFIDAPQVATDDPKARLQTLPAAAEAGCLAPGTILVLDDANRPGEAACVREWLFRYPSQLECQLEAAGSRTLAIFKWRAGSQV
jgi:predicted O-methyltransferase YrrM